MFASSKNKQAHFYFRKPSDDPDGPGCLGHNALRASWYFGNDLVYANPPWDLAEQVIAKIKRDQVKRCILVLPFRTKILDNLSIAPAIELEHSDNLFLPPSRQGKGRSGVGPPRWAKTYAYLVSGEPKTKSRVAIPKSSGPDSRFLFRCTIDENHGVALADSGCTAMVVSEDYVQRHKLKTRLCDPTEFRFANNTRKISDREVEITFRRDEYSVPLTCFVAPIKHDIILGTPWFESIQVRHLDWRSRTISFSEHGNITTEYSWSAIGKPKRIQKILSGDYSNPQAFLRHTEWAATINIERIGDLSEQELFELDHMSPEIDGKSVQDGMYNFFQVEIDSRPTPESQLLDRELDRLLAPYKAVFDKPQELPPHRQDDHAIILTDDSKVPPWRPLGNLSQYELEALKEYITDLLNKGWIEHSKSPFGANILFAKKKDGTLRVVVDYRGLNNITIKDRTPLPNIKEMQERLRGATVFTKLDLRDGFNNILIKPEDQHKTAFRTRYGHFQYRVLPFGLCNAPATFMRMMNRVFGDLYDDCIIAYVDDILIYSNTLEDHKRHLALTLERLRDHKLYLKLSKCSFATNRTEFCGTDVDSSGIYLDRSKLAPLFATRTPRNVKEVQSFLGVCNWFRDFIPQFAQTAGPLFELTKKATPWAWTPLEQNTVILLLHRISTAPCLRYYDPSLPTTLFTDASIYGIGGWLGQEHSDGIHPVFFWSRKLIPAEISYPTHERELLALVKCCEKFRPMLLGLPFLAKTDHRALIHLQNQSVLSARQVRWVQRLQEFQIVVEYIPGERNQLADLLSRSPVFAPICSICKKKQVDFDSLDSQTTTSFLDTIRQFFAANPGTIPPGFREGDERKRSKNWSCKDGLYYYGQTRLYVPRESSIRTQLLHDNHDIPMAGHQGFQRTYEKLSKNYYWHSMREDVMKYVQSCDTCQRNKVPTKSPAGLLRPLPIPDERFKDIAIDFMDLPLSKEGNDSAMLIVDRLTKLVKIIPMKKSDGTKECATMILKEWVCSGKGMFSSVVSDRDSRFTSSLWKEIVNQMQVQLNMATARHQQTNGQSEHAVKMAKGCLRSFVDYKGKNWVQLIPFIEYALNNSVSSATGYTPFELAYGTSPDKHIAWLDQDLEREIRERIKLAHVRMARYQDKMEQQANENRSEAEPIKPGDRVLLSRVGINWPAEQLSDQKLVSKYLGPSMVKSVDDNGKFQLELPGNLRIHDHFAPDVVKRYYEPNEFFPDRDVVPPIQEEYDPETEYEVEKILDHRVRRRQKQFLIRWKGHGSMFDTWEPADSGTGEEDIIAEYQRSRGGVIDWKTAGNPRLGR